MNPRARTTVVRPCDPLCWVNGDDKYSFIQSSTKQERPQGGVYDWILHFRRMTAQAAYMWSQDDWGDANREAGRDGPPHLGSPASANRKKKYIYIYIDLKSWGAAKSQWARTFRVDGDFTWSIEMICYLLIELSKKGWAPIRGNDPDDDDTVSPELFSSGIKGPKARRFLRGHHNTVEVHT